MNLNEHQMTAMLSKVKDEYNHLKGTLLEMSEKDEQITNGIFNKYESLLAELETSMQSHLLQLENQQQLMMITLMFSHL